MEPFRLNGSDRIWAGDRRVARLGRIYLGCIDRWLANVSAYGHQQVNAPL